MNAPQIVDIQYGDRRLWFEVWRYEHDADLYAALHRDGIHLKNIKSVVAYTESYPIGKAAEGEAGKMYLLDKSVRILAEQATIMADGIIGAYGPVNPPTDAIAVLIGEITSQLYSQSRHF